MAKWKISEVARMHGPVLLRVWRGYDEGPWYTAVHLHLTDIRVYTNPTELIGFKSRADALRMLNEYAETLGPVEPVLALVRFFGAARDHVRARRAA